MTNHFHFMVWCPGVGCTDATPIEVLLFSPPFVVFSK